MKFNLEEEKIKLADIMSNKPKAKIMTQEELKKSVIKNLPRVENESTRDFMQSLGIEQPANTPAEGLEKKMRYWKDKDTSVQERILFAQSWNLAVALVSQTIDCVAEDTDIIEPMLERWQQYFYQQLKNQNGN